MSTIVCESHEADIPTPDESEAAKLSSRHISQIMADARSSRFVKIMFGSTEEKRPFTGRQGKMLAEEMITIPSAALRMLNDILVQMAKGNTVTIIPIHAELTTQEAADHLNVSRPFLIQQLEKGTIPYHKVGSHRRIRFKDLMEYKKKKTAESEEAMRQLIADSQEMGLY